MELPFTQVDAFADRPFTGNPAAIVELDEWLDEATLLAIAQENNLAETAFVLPERDATAHTRCAGSRRAWRWRCAGMRRWRPAICSCRAIRRSTAYAFSTERAGLLEVARSGERYALTLPVWRAEPRPLPELVAALGLASGDVRETLWHRAEYAVIALADEAAVRAVDPDFRAIAAMGPLAAIVTAPALRQAQGKRVDVVSRVFVPGADVDEDPVTGSAHAVLTPYWSERLGRPRFTAHQASPRGGTLECELNGDRAVLTGGAVTVIEGRLTI